MSEQIWPKPPMKIVQSFEARSKGRGPVGALIIWAVWGVESLHYLDDLDHEHHGSTLNNSPHHPNVKDIAHVRWATVTAISSLDLCAASLGREYCAWNKTRELDLRNFDQTSNSKTKSKRREMLPTSALSWIDGVLSDSRYIEVHGARNPLTHSRLTRKLFSNKSTEFQISSTGSGLTVRDLVILSKDIATDQVIAFLEIINGI